MPPVRFHRGTAICEQYELRVTARCLTDDLGESAGVDLEEVQRHEIVRAFCNQRSQSPTGTRTIGPAASAQTLHRLGHGNDHRGATWFDADADVVWLCATGFHRSGEPEDAFRYFHDLIAQDVIYPTSEDYQRLEEERAERFVAFAPDDLTTLLLRAEQQPGVEVRAVIGGAEELGIVVVVVETVDELFVACSLAAVADPTRIVFILNALGKGRLWDDWSQPSELPTRPLQANEICFSLLRERV